MKKQTISIIIFLVLALCLSGSPQDSKKETNQKQKKKKNRIVAAPLCFYTPETRLAFGGAGSYIFRTSKKPNARPSTIAPVVIYTLEKQFITRLNGDVYFKKDMYRAKSEFRFLKYPSKFYGIGGGTMESNEEAYTSKEFGFAATFYRRFGLGISLGIKYNFAHWSMVEVEEGSQLASGLILGSNGGSLSGLGFIANRDTRDNIYSPHKGDLFEFSANFYGDVLGSDFNFSKFRLDLRKYFPVFSEHVIAVQGVAEIQNGDVPFNYLSRLGGQNLLRGFYEGRYRDRSMIAFQAEYRLPVFWRFGLVAFAGVGNVGDRFSDIKWDDMKFSYGFGLRFLFDKKERIQIRIDVGFGENGSSGFYASIFEAF